MPGPGFKAMSRARHLAVSRSGGKVTAAENRRLRYRPFKENDPWTMEMCRLAIATKRAKRLANVEA